MAITKAKKAGQGIIGGVGAIQQYDLTLDNSWLAIGEIIDLSDDFATVDSVQIGGQVAIIGAAFSVKIPASGVAVSATNVVLMAHYSAGADGVMNPVADAVDLSACNPLTITVIGKPKVAV